VVNLENPPLTDLEQTTCSVSIAASYPTTAATV